MYSVDNFDVTEVIRVGANIGLSLLVGGRLICDLGIILIAINSV